MNFFAEQDQARRRSKYLLLLFGLAVVCLIVVTNVLVAITIWLIDGQLENYGQVTDILSDFSSNGVSDYFNWQNFGKISLIVSAVIACVIAFKWLQLRGGGRRVAESLGGRPINPNTDDANARRVLNVVAEMALASGMPVPAVYLLAGEKGINAFAAGSTPANAVIGITQGAIEQFDRQQLQGVVAHEFSHILNGDMRLNLRMTALLSGILFIGSIGELIMHSGGRYAGANTGKRSGDVRIFILGLGFVLIGWLGTFFGGLIKAALNRQREFLADASAVQFTRNPQGISEALKIIGGYNVGSRVFSAQASDASHMFIAKALGRLASFDTHPALAKRIRRIEPHWDGQMINRQIKVELNENADSTLSAVKDSKRPVAVAAAIGTAYVAANNKLKYASIKYRHSGLAKPTTISPVDAAKQGLDAIPHHLKALCLEPLGASALVYCLLLDSKSELRKKQYGYIEMTGVKGLSSQCLQIQADVAKLAPSQRLPLIELAMPALKLMSAEQYKLFKKTLLLIIRADKQFEIFEWILFQMIRHYLDAEFEASKPSKPQFNKVQQIASDYAVVLSALSIFGNSGKKDQQRAFYRGANTLGLYTLEMKPADVFSMDEFIKAVNKLANCYPLIKPKILKGFIDCIRQDGEVTALERDVISAIAAVMDCPLPLVDIE